MIYKQDLYEYDEEKKSFYIDGYRLTQFYDPEDCKKITVNDVTLQDLINLIESDLEDGNYHRHIEYTNKLIDAIMDEVGVTITKQIIWSWINDGGLNA